MNELRMRDADGAQLVTVSTGYAYRWTGAKALKIGDEVELPGSPIAPDGWFDVVSVLGSHYGGRHGEVVGLAS